MPDERQTSTGGDLPSFTPIPHPLVIGLGNPLLGDDGVGWHVASYVKRALRGMSAQVEIDFLAVGGLRLMERLIGYQRVILIDAISTGQRPIGSIHRLQSSDLPGLADRQPGHLSSVHDSSLQTALEVGYALGVPLPNELVIVAVEAGRVFDFTERLTQEVAAAVPQAGQMIIELLGLNASKEGQHDLC